MIIARLCGGLGNQLFQYAAARSLSERLQLPLMLDTTWFQARQDRGYRLNIFRIKAGIASQKDIAVFRARQQTGFWHTQQNKNGHNVFREEHFHVNPAFFDLNGPVYLDGYWQSEKYFASIKAQLREELTYQQASTGQNSNILEEIRSANVPTVSLHVRRADYIQDPRIAKVLYTCPLEYYHKAVAAITQKLTNPFFYVFSDDIAWCEQNLKLPHAFKIIRHNPPGQEGEDFRLMSACRHHITANSSFSWWGAWLKPDPQKIVICPLNWFKNKSYNDKDLIPAGWVRL